MAKDKIEKKVIVVGPKGCGKSRGLLDNLLNHNNDATKFIKTEMEKAYDFPIGNDNFKLFETISYGNQAYPRTRYYPEADLFLLCFALNDKDKVKQVESFITEIKFHKTDARIIVVGLKGNLAEQDNADDIRELCKKYCLTYVEGPGQQYASLNIDKRKEAINNITTAITNITNPGKKSVVDAFLKDYKVRPWSNSQRREQISLLQNGGDYDLIIKRIHSQIFDENGNRKESETRHFGKSKMEALLEEYDKKFGLNLFEPTHESGSKLKPGRK